MRNDFPERDLFSPATIENIQLPNDKTSRFIPILRALQELGITRPDLVMQAHADLVRYCSSKTGRKGMDGWRVIVLLAIKTGMDLNYKFLSELASYHMLLRDMMQVSATENFSPKVSTLHDNIMLLRPETIEAINDALIEIGVKKNFEAGRAVRGDSYVCQTNIHYPTDISLVYDGVRKIIELCVEHSEGKNGWRQYRHLLKKAKQLCRAYSKVKRSRRKDKEQELKKLVREYLKFARIIIEKSLTYLTEHTECTIELPQIFPANGTALDSPLPDLEKQLFYFMAGTEYMCTLVHRRLIEEEPIAHSEKVHSLFEPHSQLINRGKFPNPIEFGHRVFLAQGKSGLILNHQVMGIGVTDDKILLPVLQELSERFNSKLDVCSFDKGFYSPDNLEQSRDYSNLVVLPRKGRLSKAAHAEQSDGEYVNNRKWRSGIESLISCMVRANGAGVCPDKGYRGFKKHISACVLARNLQTLGMHLLAEDRGEEHTPRKRKSA